MDNKFGLLLFVSGNFRGMEWMEQSNLMQYLEAPPVVDDDLVIAEPMPLLLDDDFFSTPALSSSTPDLAVEEEKVPETKVPPGGLLQSLLLQQTDLMGLLKARSPASPAPSSPEAQVAPEIDFTAKDMPSAEEIPDAGKAEYLHFQEGLSSDDLESIISSAASSPLSTVDTSNLYSEDGSLVCNASDLFEVVSNVEKKARSTPYSRPRMSSKSTKSKGRKKTASISPNPSELELELMSKKDRKKLQNKNAAIRYRMKKKAESDNQKAEEEELESINKGLVEKVEQLTREIKYMKDLIREVREARGLPPLAS